MDVSELRSRLGRFVMHNVRPPGDRRRDERGRCSVCGWTGRFPLNSWMLPRDMVRDLGDEAVTDSFRRRESLWCRRCGASLRIRRIADVLLLHYGEAATTLAELVGEARFRSLDVAEVNSIGTAHDVLARHPRLRYSEYPEEDVSALSYPDAAFDLVLTSDTLEHVPDYRAALRETRRVLRPGGRHVFTVPAVASRERTVTRAALDEHGELVHRALPQHHCRGSGPFALAGRHADLLAYTDFGLDLVDELAAAGFDAETHFADEDETAFVFCARAV